jgi:hypothetical protein
VLSQHKGMARETPAIPVQDAAVRNGKMISTR